MNLIQITVVFCLDVEGEDELFAQARQTKIQGN